MRGPNTNKKSPTIGLGQEKLNCLSPFFFLFYLFRAELLDSVIFRAGIVATLRSKKLDGKVIGVMITASHNPAAVRILLPRSVIQHSIDAQKETTLITHISAIFHGGQTHRTTASSWWIPWEICLKAHGKHMPPRLLTPNQTSCCLKVFRRWSAI